MKVKRKINMRLFNLRLRRFQNRIHQKRLSKMRRKMKTLNNKNRLRKEDKLFKKLKKILLLMEILR